MRLLVDTQCWLWLCTAPERFSPERRRQLERADTTLLLSAASAWEIAIKFELGKLALPERPADYVPGRLRLTKTSTLAIGESHALEVAELPRHHRDPFDRLIIAQARLERLTILTADPQFDRYDVQLLDP